MRAVVHDRYGPPDVLRLEEVERPVPRDDEVLVKIHATTVNRTDTGFRSAEMFLSRFFTGLRRPKRRILGMELAGEVEAVGAAVNEFEVGDDVTAVCNTKNLELVRSLGADEVVDYTQEDFTKNGKTYDVIFDAVGKHSFRRCRRSLKPGGTYSETDLGFLWHVPLLALLTRLIGDKRVKLGIARYTKKDVLFLKELIEAGKYRAVIDRSYPLEDVVEATRYVETEQKTGNVVLTVSGDRGT